MKRTTTAAAYILAGVVLVGSGGLAGAAPKKDKAPAQQKEADRHFKSGVALFKEAKYAEALAEFERAYEIAPHPLVLYNIAGCHRELSHYAEAVSFYRKFLSEGKGKVPPERIAAAQKELDGILARVARVTVTLTFNDGATLTLDGSPIASLDQPLIVPPGEHKLVAKAPGRKDAEKTVRVASGDAVDIALELPELPAETATTTTTTEPTKETAEEMPFVPPEAKQKRFGINAAFGTNLTQINETGAPSVGLAVAINSRLEIGIDAIVVAYAVMPSLRVRLAGTKVAVHAAAAVPISFTDGAMSETFVAGALGLGLRMHATPSIAFRLESFVSIAGAAHGTTFPTFFGGELWF